MHYFKILILASLLVSGYISGAARNKAGDLVYEDQESIKATVVPIFEELERKELLAPVEAAQIEAREQTGNESTALVDMALVRTRAELDIEATRTLSNCVARNNALSGSTMKRHSKSLTSSMSMLAMS